MIDETTNRRKRPVYFWDEDLYKRNKKHFLFRTPILFVQSTKGVISAVFASNAVKETRYTGEVLRQLRRERGVGRPPRVREAQRAKLLEGMSA